MKRKMRDSGVAWIGEVPEGWKLCRIASLYELRNTKCSNREFAPLSVTMKGVMPQLEQVAKTNNGDDRKLVCAGDFVINSRSDRRGACGISQLDGSVSLINIVMKPRGAMDAAYYSWVFKSNGFADEFYAWGHGIVDDLWTTRWSDMKNILVMVPPLPEQQAIADYLDCECGKIDELRAKIEAQIADLATYKKSVITEAVTGKCKIENGEWKMRPRTELRDSGVEWIGEVPEGWKVGKLSYCFDIQLGKMLDAAKIVGNYLVSYLRNQDVQWGVVKTDGLPQMDIYPAERDKFKVVKGDLLVCEGGDVGRCAIWNSNEDMYFQKAIMRLRPKNKNFACARWMYYQIFCAKHNGAFDNVTGKATIAHLPAEKLAVSKFAFPPLPEQREIADYLDKKCGSIDAAVAKCRAQLEDLATYKKSLIFECVTGKKEIA